LDDALESLKFGDDHREAARWLKEKREQAAVGEPLADVAAAEAALKKLADQVRGVVFLRVGCRSARD
jgi:hypothetical protein